MSHIEVGALALYLVGWIEWAGAAWRRRIDATWWLVALGGCAWPVIAAGDAAERLLLDHAQGKRRREDQ